jgi:hypothetical protein
VRIPAKALEVSTILVHATLYKDLQLLKKSARWMINKLLYVQGEKERASHDVPGVHSNNCCRFLTILDNVLMVGESTGPEERAGRPHLHLGNLLEGDAEGNEKTHLCHVILR